MEDFEYPETYEKRGRQNIKKNKFGLVSRSGATLRRNEHTDRYHHRGGHCQEFAIIKHVLQTRSQSNRTKSSSEIKQQFAFDDGEMHDFNMMTKYPSTRRQLFSPISRKWKPDDSVLYSMNKKKRWLLPDMIRGRIDNDVCKENGPKEALFDVTMIEREITSGGGFLTKRNNPDVVKVSTTVKIRNQSMMRKNAWEPKRNKYAWSTDLLGMTQTKVEDTNEVERNENIKPEIIYEICRPTSRDRYPNHSQEKSQQNYFKKTLKPRRKAKRDFQSSQSSVDASWNEYISTKEQADGTVLEDRITKEQPLGTCSVGLWFDDLEKINDVKNTKRPKSKFGSSCANISMKERLFYNNAKQVII